LLLNYFKLLNLNKIISFLQSVHLSKMSSGRKQKIVVGNTSTDKVKKSRFDQDTPLTTKSEE
jgi:hypothetical protein